MAPYEQSGYNPYDIRIKCAVPPLCYDMSAANTYFNSAPVRAALGVGDAKWSVCNFQVNQMLYVVAHAHAHAHAHAQL